MTLREQLDEDLRQAMRERDKVRVSVLRSTLSAVANAEAVDPSEHAAHVSEVARRSLTEDEIRAIVVAERDDLAATATIVGDRGQVEAATDLAAKAAVLTALLAD